MDDVSKALCLLTALGNVLEDVLGNDQTVIEPENLHQPTFAGV